MQRPPEREQIVTLEWSGPFGWTSDGVVSFRDPALGPTDDVLRRLGDEPGIYMILGDHHAHGPNTLLYVGKSDKLRGRLDQHDRWAADEWRAEVYLAPMPRASAKLVAQVEALLIYAHSPAYNSRHVQTRAFDSDLRLWNTGRFARLLPEVSGSHPWQDEM